MRAWTVGFLLLVAGCGDPQIACGGAGQPCCANNACSTGTTCTAGTCATPKMCGMAGLPCCLNSVCVDGACMNGTCVTIQCGDLGDACCDGTTCHGVLGCLAGTCTDMGKSGDPCTKSGDCLGSKPVCLTKDSRGVTWPNGYCTSACNPMKNDLTSGLNPSCPGGGGSCQGSGSTGTCEAECTAMSGDAPCTRAGYSCFSETTNVCEPTSRSQCNPTMKLSCPQDGGASIFVPPPDGGPDDGGMTITSSRSCAKIGDDDVGQCVDGCDPLAPQMVGAPSAPCLATQACYPNYTTGDGECFLIIGGGATDGAPCMYKNQCNPGLSCHAENMLAFCRPLCGGPGNIACPNGESCMDISSTVKATLIGICGK